MSTTVTARNSARPRRGTTLVFIALFMVIIVGMVAFAVDVGRMYLVRAELQAAVDAGTLAASLKLREDPNDINGAMAAARQYVQENKVGLLETVPDESITIEAGTWNSATRSFTAGGSNPNAVRVFADQAGEPLFFSRVWGLNQFAVPRDAIATFGEGQMDIMMTLDLSGSMGSQGRIEALQAAAPVFVDVIDEAGSSDRIGVMGYGALRGSYDPVGQGHDGTVYVDTPSSLYPASSDWAAVLEHPLTFDFDWLRDHVLTASTLTDNKYNGWTPLGAAIRDSAHYLATHARPDTTKFMVLMSDGHANKPSGNGPGYALEMANYANSHGIMIFTISLGNAADEQLMEDIAALTGGKHFLARGDGGGNLSAELTEAFRKVANAIKGSQLVH